MSRLIILHFFCFWTLISYSQVRVQYQTGQAAEDNLKRIINIKPGATGGLGYDLRYEGFIGSPMLFGKMVSSYLKMSGLDEYLKLNSDLDIYNNMLMFIHPKTGKLLSIPANFVTEVIVVKDSIDDIFRTTANYKFEKEFKEVKFFQVLKGGPWQLIKMPRKELIEANYKSAYSAGIKYDEFETSFKYYIMGSDGILHSLQLNKKSLIKLFPEKKSYIESVVNGRANKNDEEMILSIINGF
jgi:hypothetical protein